MSHQVCVKIGDHLDIYNSRYDPNTEQCSSLDCTNISFLSFTLSLSSQISVVEFINQSFDLYDRLAFKMNIYHILGHFIVLDFIIKHVLVKELLIL